MLVPVVALALADIPPPPGYTETCTVELACPSAQGVVCSGSFFGDRTVCEREWATKGYSKACQTRGASTWDEVWCSNAAPPGPLSDAPAEPTTPSEPGSPDVRKTSRCSSMTGSATWIFAVVGLLGLRRRRR